MTPEVAPALRSAGYGALWLGSADSELTGAERALDATSTLVVARFTDEDLAGRGSDGSWTR